MRLVMRTIWGGVSLVATLAGCAHPHPNSRPAMVEYIPVAAGRAGQRPPFSAAVRVGRTLYLSGQLGTDSTGKVVPGGIAAETRQALENIKRVLEDNGSSLDNVVKCTAMLADIHEWAGMNEVYATYFPHHLPARSAFGTSGLVKDGRIELECIATVDRH